MEKKVSWQGTMKSAEPKVVMEPASTVMPMVVAASVILPARSAAVELIYACERCSV